MTLRQDGEAPAEDCAIAARDSCDADCSVDTFDLEVPARPMSLRVLVADDHALLRHVVRRLLENSDGIAHVGEAQNADQVLDQLQAASWDVVVLDIDMPGQNSLYLLEWIKDHHPEIAVLMLSMYPEEQFGLRTIRAGAAGYLNKGANPDQLVTAVRRLGEGGAYISAGLASSLASRRSPAPAEVEKAVPSQRERAVLRGIAEGKSICAIARELNLSAKTVSTYRARLLLRLNLRTNIELARYAAESELVD
jgi:DNA-binding NarL/FixJ family response regulator